MKRLSHYTQLLLRFWPCLLILVLVLGIDILAINALVTKLDEPQRSETRALAFLWVPLILVPSSALTMAMCALVRKRYLAAGAFLSGANVLVHFLILRSWDSNSSIIAYIIGAVSLGQGFGLWWMSYDGNKNRSPS